MLNKSKDTITAGFLDIVEKYPDDFILVKIVEIDHTKGVETGIVLCTSKSREALVSYVQCEGITEDTIILQGENLTPLLGGLI